MSLYTIMLFVHVSGAVCLFVSMGIWLFGITVIARGVRLEQVRTLADLMLMARLLVPVSAFVVIAAGLTMARISCRPPLGESAKAARDRAVAGSGGCGVARR